MRCVGLIAAWFVFWCCPLAAQELPRSLDPRLRIELFAEQPLIATPTGLDVDSRGGVWAIECNTHFRPENYPGHPSDRILVFRGRGPDGLATAPTLFADGFTATMSVAVRPIWMPPIRLKGVEQGDAAALARTTQVFVATRSQIVLLEDASGDDVADRRSVLFELDTKGNYPHNGFAGFAFDAFGAVFVGMGENLGEPYKVRDRSGAVVYEHDEGGHLYQFQPDGTGFRLWATGCWNPHANCFDAFGRMFSVDNDPDSRPPCRLLHIIEGGDYGYHFKNGRKGLHPFTSWNGELPGTLPMVAGTGEAPSGVLAYEHSALPAEYRGHLLATSWGDHRIDVFRLKPKGLSFESVAEPVIVGGENFRPVGLALAPDGSLFCTDWVLRDYKLHGKGRIWRISAVDGPATSPDYAALQAEQAIPALKKALESPVGTERRLAARRIGAVNGLQNVGVVRDAQASERARYEAMAAIVVKHDSDEPRQIREYAGQTAPPFDAVQTLVMQFGEARSIQRMQALLADPQGSDPMYVLGGVKVFVPVLRTVASSGSPKIVELLNRAVATMDAFALSALVREVAAGLPGETLRTLIASDAALSPRLRLAIVLAAKRQDPADEAAMAKALLQREAVVRRAAVQWIGERRVKALRPAVERCLSESPMDRDLFLSTIAALEMLDGKDPKDFDKTPAGKYVAPLLKDEKTPPAVLVEALRLVDPDDTAVTVERLARLLTSENFDVRKEAATTLVFRQENEGQQLQMMIDLSKEFPTITSLAAARRLGGTGGELQARLQQLLPPRKSVDPSANPMAVSDWRSAAARANEHDSSDRGWLLFHRPDGPGCSRCHTIHGRGGKVGPDLSKIGASFTREKLIDSILEPSREVSPQFTTWQMVHVDGRVFTGMIVHENEGKTILGDSDGKTVELKTADIEERRPVKASVMPEKLVDRMTVQEWRDLLAFLESLK